MFLPIILDFENNGKKFMLLKYLQFINACFKYDWPIITHEEYDKYEINFPNRSEYRQDTMNKYNYKLWSYEERKQIDQYFIPKQVFLDLEKEQGSKLEAMLFLLENNFVLLEEILEEYISNLIEKRKEKPEAILYYAECPKSVKIIAEKYQIPMLSFEMGPIREKNYRCTTSYLCKEGLYTTCEAADRFEKFKKEMEKGEIPIFSREELLLMFVNKKYVNYISLIDMIPQFEIGVAGGCGLVVPYFAKDKYMDHELIDDIFELYDPKKVLVRLHPGDMYQATYRLRDYDNTPSPFSFLLRCRRIAAVGSNLLFEAMLWKRIPCCKTSVMPATLFCSKDYKSTKVNSDMLAFINFYIFSFLIPFEYSLDEEYIRWRLKEPSEKEIFNKNLNYYLLKFGISDEWLTLNRNERLNILKAYREYESITINELLEETSMSSQRNSILEHEEMLLKAKQDREYLEEILRSTCWRMTKPIRKILDVLKR